MYTLASVCLFVVPSSVTAYLSHIIVTEQSNSCTFVLSQLVACVSL